LKKLSLILLASFFSLFALILPVYSQTATRIVFLGDSLTAGLGLDLDEAYPALIQEKIDAEGFDGQAVNAGLSGDTTAGGLRRLDWLLRGRIDILVLALGANDGLRGLPTTEMANNLLAIIEKTRSRYPNAKIIVAGMLVPPNQGREYEDAYRQAFLDVTNKTNSLAIPFLLAGVAGLTDKNQPDGIHPNKEGQRIIADTVWRALKPLLKRSTK